MSERHGEAESAGTSTSGGPTVIDVTPTLGAEQHPETLPKSGATWLAIAALIALVLALATSPYWAPPLSSVLPWGGAEQSKPTVDTSTIEARLNALEARVADLAQVHQRAAALEQRVGQLEQRPAPAPNPQDARQAAQQAQALIVLGDRIAGLEARITSIAAAAQSSETATDATKGLQAQLQALSQKLDEQSHLIENLRSQNTTGADRAGAVLVLSVGQLRAALATSRPYAAELQAAEALAKDQPDILKQLQALDARAETGIATIGMLRERFDAVAGEIDRVSVPPSQSSWGGQVVGWAKRFFHVRQVGEPSTKESNDPDQVLASTETALGSGDLAGTVVTLRRLQGPAAEAVKPWLDDAQARLAADKTLAALDMQLTRSIVAPPAGAKP